MKVGPAGFDGVEAGPEGRVGLKVGPEGFDGVNEGPEVTGFTSSLGTEATSIMSISQKGLSFQIPTPAIDTLNVIFLRNLGEISAAISFARNPICFFSPFFNTHTFTALASY